ncbi:MAG: trypsin-like serine protease [Bacteroidetes bacterium]|nr:trypsin-like serine protease [Bacteroidota bacterium]
MNVGLLLLVLLPLTLIGQKAEKVFVQTNHAVVRIIVRDRAGQTIAQGSGVVMKDQGWVVTNQHVVRDAYLILAEHEGRYFPLDSIVAVDAQRDIFIMAIAESQDDFSWREIPALKLVEQDEVAVGQKVYAIGSPFSFENTMTEGIVSGLRSSINKQQNYIQISAPFSSGSSGGAVLDKKGRLLGISTWVVGTQGAQNLNFVIPIWDVLAVAEAAFRKKNANKGTESLQLSAANRLSSHEQYAERIYKFKAGLHLKLAEIYRTKGDMQKAMEHQQEASRLLH